MKKSAGILIAAVLASSCAPTTPQGRIGKSPENFAGLSQKDQALVRQGLISRGMPPDAVELAWGPPSQRLEGSENSRPTERWEYAGSRPVYFTNVLGGYGSWYGGPGIRGGGYGYPGYGFGVGPDVAYVPYRVASVRFIDRRVDSWERVR